MQRADMDDMLSHQLQPIILTKKKYTIKNLKS